MSRREPRRNPHRLTEVLSAGMMRVGRDNALPTEKELTYEEKKKLLRLGKVGRDENTEEWLQAVEQIMEARGGKYPSDWTEQIIEGDLYMINDGPEPAKPAKPVPQGGG